MRLWLVRNLCRTGLQVGWWWWGSGGTMHLEERHVEKYANMEACNVGGNLFNLHFTIYHYLFCLFVLDLPANAWSFIVETTK